MPEVASRVRHAAAVLALSFFAAATVPAFAADEITVARTSIDDTKEVLATIESVRSPQARARIGGTLDTVAVVEGDRVKKGDVLATVVDPKLKLQLAAFDQRIAALQAKLELIGLDLDRVRRLRETGSAPQSRLDDAETQAIVTRAEIAAARADRAVVEEQVAEGRILAPDDGRILSVKSVVGQVIMPGEPVAVLASAGYVMKLRLPERHARTVHVGDRVLVAGHGSTGPLGEGRIVRVYPELDQGRVVADAEAPGIGDYFVGERVRVVIAAGRRDAVVLPVDRLIRREGLTFVRLAGRGEVPVQTGEHLAEANAAARIEILSGLIPGDVVVKP
jgi:RND family efflux transporter MFP subunit